MFTSITSIIDQCLKYGFKLELQRPETMTLLGTTKINKQNKKGENVKAFEVFFSAMLFSR